MSPGPKEDLEQELEDMTDEVEELNPDRDLSWGNMGGAEYYD